jgi:hypothetical protein
MVVPRREHRGHKVTAGLGGSASSRSSPAQDPLTVLSLMAYRWASSDLVAPAQNSATKRDTPASPRRSMTRCWTRGSSAERTLTLTGSPASPTLSRSTALTSSDTRSTCFE